MIKYIMMLVLCLMCFGVSEELWAIETRYELITVRGDDETLPDGQWTYDNLVQEIQDAKAEGKIPALALQRIFFFPTGDNSPHPDCEEYDATKPVSNRSGLYSNWLQRGQRLMWYHPEITNIGMIYLHDEINVWCTNKQILKTVMDAFEFHLPHIDIAIGYAIGAPNRGVGAAPPEGTDIIATWNYGLYDPLDTNNPLNGNTVTLETYADFFGDTPIVWALPMWCTYWNHNHQLGWTDSCISDFGRIYEAFWNQAQYLKETEFNIVGAVTFTDKSFGSITGVDGMPPFAAGLQQLVYDDLQNHQ